MRLVKKKQEPKKRNKVEEQEKLESFISKRRNILANALRIPPAINQFNTTLSEEDTEKLFNLFKKYSPETRKEKEQRIKETGGEKVGPKPILIKFGIKHVTDLIERKIAKFVVIAADVDPLEVVIFLPTLCKKMGIPYSIVKSKELLGNLVHLKQTAVVCLCEYRAEDQGEWNDVVGKSKAMFYDSYENMMGTWGGGILLTKMAAEIVPEE